MGRGEGANTGNGLRMPTLKEIDGEKGFSMVGGGIKERMGLLQAVANIKKYTISSVKCS